jgi:DNA-directed RNA polymerase specialized sigma24 family protein
MNRDRSLTQTAFDSLLTWLDADHDRAGEKYEQIRRRLIKFFTCRGRHDAEELADETINRVALKAPELSKEYVGDPSLYFYGVAQKIFLESLRKPPAAPPPPPPPEPADLERDYECLDRCLAELAADNRVLVLDYYREDGRAKIERRKEMARRLGIALNALRIRAFRIRMSLQQCVQKCIEQGSVS